MYKNEYRDLFVTYLYLMCSVTSKTTGRDETKVPVQFVFSIFIDGFSKY
jgi:hypothetical protein